MKIMVKIGAIDMFGYCGRDNHPLNSDSGKVAELMELTLQRYAIDPFDDIDVVTVKILDKSSPNGHRVVDLVEHEIEAMHYGNPRIRDMFPAPDICEGCASDEDYSVEKRDDPRVEPGTPKLCDGCYDATVQDAQEEADRKMGDRNP